MQRRAKLKLALAVACLSLCTAGAARTLQQFDCEGARLQCEAQKCKGKVTFNCDIATAQTSCKCESAGLADCFPGSATVRTAGGLSKPLSEVQLGEAVLSVGQGGTLQYSPVYMWSSRRPAQQASFLKIRTDAGLNVTVTPGHFMFAWSGAGAQQAARAALGNPAAWPYVLPTKISVGDVVPVAGAGSPGGSGVPARPMLARVLAVERVQEQGVFMPHTQAGVIVVDGVVASELTSLVPPALAGHRVSRSLAAALRLGFAALPAGAVEGAVRRVSAFVHGTPDADVSAPALFSAPASAA